MTAQSDVGLQEKIRQATVVAAEAIGFSKDDLISPDAVIYREAAAFIAFPGTLDKTAEDSARIAASFRHAALDPTGAELEPECLDILRAMAHVPQARPHMIRMGQVLQLHADFTHSYPPRYAEPEDWVLDLKAHGAALETWRYGNCQPEGGTAEAAMNFIADHIKSLWS